MLCCFTKKKKIDISAIVENAPVTDWLRQGLKEEEVKPSLDTVKIKSGQLGQEKSRSRNVDPEQLQIRPDA